MPDEWSPTPVEVEKAWARYEMLQDLAAELWNRYEDMFLSQMIDEGDVPFLESPEPPEPCDDLEDDMPF